MTPPRELRTQVGIVGAGPAGLLLSHLLHLEGIDSVVLERQSRAHCEGRIRAGVLEQGTVDLLRDVGLAERLLRQGLVHRGVELATEGRRRRIDFEALTGKCVTVYGQHEVVRDLIAARVAADAELWFEVGETSPRGLDSDDPEIHFMHGGRAHVLRCDFVAGCDGFHGVCRASIPASERTEHERVFPFAWLGILAAAPPSSDELIYTHHERGFALHSMRSPEVTRHYLQCEPDEDIARWPDARIWEELQRRMAVIDGGGEWRLTEGPVLEKGITAMRSFVAEPMRHGRLFLAGDAAHIVPPTGAKGMNLAVADVRALARGLDGFYRRGRADGLERYSTVCLRRVWKAQYFSQWMTAMFHRFPDDPGFHSGVQSAQIDYVTGSTAAATSLAECYVGLPFED